MTTSSFPQSRARLGLRAHQVGGLAFVLGNFLFVVNKLDEMSRLFLGRPMPDVISGRHVELIALGQAMLVIGYVAYNRFYTPRGDRPARIALGLFSTGGVVLAIGHVSFMSALANYIPRSLVPYAEGLFLLVILGMLLLLSGLIWFGILSLRQPLLSRWRWLPLFTGLMGFIGFIIFSGEEITAIFLAFRTLFACGLIGLGLSLWLERPALIGAQK